MKINNFTVSFSPITFLRDAIDWYMRLPPKSINIWLQNGESIIDDMVVKP